MRIKNLLNYKKVLKIVASVLWDEIEKEFWNSK